MDNFLLYELVFDSGSCLSGDDVETITFNLLMIQQLLRHDLSHIIFVTNNEMHYPPPMWFIETF